MEISMNNTNYNANYESILTQEEIQELLAELTGTATESTTKQSNIIQFPMYTTEQMETETPELQVVPWVNDRNAALNHKREIIQRNHRAKRYIQRCKANEDFECLIGGVSVFTFIAAISFLMTVLL